MSKIDEEYTFGSINIQTFFRLPIARGKDNCFLVNEGRNSVVKVQDRKLLHSWTLTHPNSFTCPVIIDENEAVYGIMNCNTLLKWSPEDDTLKNAVKFKFKDAVFAVLPICGMQPIVLFSNGKVLRTETLPSSTEPIGSSFLNKTEDMIWADATSFQSKILIVCLSVSKKNKSYKLHSFAISKDSVTGYFNQVLAHESDVLKSWCLNKSTASFFSLWSSGLLLSHQFDSPEQSTLFTVPDVHDLDLLALDSIDSNHIALVKCNLTDKKTILGIWDVQFVALKATKLLKSASQASSLQIFAADSMLFLSYNEELIELSFQVEKSTLVAAMGRSTTSTPKRKEFFCKKAKLTQVTSASEKMDTSEREENTLSPTELIAQRLMDEGTAYLKYIPEYELVKLLSLAIRCKLKEKNLNVKFEPDVVLTAIFSSSFSDVSLMKYMKILNMKEAMVTFETLLSLLENKLPLTNTSCARPSDLQLFNWICLVLQSRMDAFLTPKNKKCIKVMKKLDKCLSEKMTEYEDYESIQSVFFSIQRKKNILPEKYVDSRYCIETLDT